MTRFAVGKSPIAALFFAALLPGLGQFYNGDFKKGFMILILAVILFALLFETACSSGFFLAGVWLWGLVNAFNVAARKTPLWA